MGACGTTVFAFTSTIPTVQLLQNSAASNISFPSFTLTPSSSASCWTFTYAVAETTATQKMVDYDSLFIVTLNSSTTPTLIKIPAMQAGLVAAGSYYFEIKSTNANTLVSETINFKI